MLSSRRGCAAAMVDATRMASALATCERALTIVNLDCWCVSWSFRMQVFVGNTVRDTGKLK